MGVFNDELRKHMAGEANPRQVAHRVSGALLSTVPDDIDVESRENHVTLRSRSWARWLEITCEGPGAFLLHESYGGQTQVSEPPSGQPSRALALDEMASEVTGWIEAAGVRRQ
jgi:hypothetical protein